MKFARVSCILALTFALSEFVFLTPADAQQEPSRIIRIRDLSTDEVRSPQYRAGGIATSGQQKEWIQVLLEYDTAPDWIDELKVDYYVLLKGREKGETKRLLCAGTMNYVNIEKGRSHKSVMYIHPSTVARYGDIEAVAVMIKHEGRLEALVTDPKSNHRWWEGMSPKQGYLLNRMETPFAMVNFDDFEAIKASPK